MMIKCTFDQKLKALNIGSQVLVSDKEFILEEKKADGRAYLKCILDKYSIAFTNADENTCKYLKEKKCADVIVIQREENKWNLKIIEFKKTITSKSLKKSIEQFKGAILNALVIGGFLEINNFNNVSFYSAYRSDKMNDFIKNTTNPVALKNPKLVKENNELINIWNDERISFEILRSSCIYKKIILDEDGNGEVKL